MGLQPPTTAAVAITPMATQTVTTEVTNN